MKGRKEMKKTADVMSKIWKWLLVFGFVFSEVSFPLEVLADELMSEDNTYQEVAEVSEFVDTNLEELPEDKPVITVNGVETTEYTIEDNTSVVVILEYQEDTLTVEFDFSKKLYGVYQYTFEGFDEVVTINYVGNNASLLEVYKNTSNETESIVCNETECVISGFGLEELTVADITSSYYDLVKFSEDYDASVLVSNEEGTLLETDLVVNGYKLEIVDNQSDLELVNTTPETVYVINRVGDVEIPSDGVIDVKDQEAVLDDVLQDNEITNVNDVNGDGILNILDVTHSTYMDLELVEGEVTDVLTNTLTSDKDELLVGEVAEVKLLISGFDKLSLYGLEGLLNYDENVLDLVEATVYVPAVDVIADGESSDTLGYLNLENGKFAYVLKNGFNDSEMAILTLKFEALAAGVSEVSISNIVASYGEAFELDNDSASVSVTVLEDGKGGDVEEDTDDSLVTDDDKPSAEVVVRPVVLSSDYYIKSLVINGYELDFDMYTYDYELKVKNDVTSLDISVLLNSNESIYYVEGNENFEVGENLVYLVVRAENGSTKTYTIRVEREKESVVNDNNGAKIEEEVLEDEGKGNTSKTVIIILIILVIMGLIYVIFKDDEEDKKEVKKVEKTDDIRIEKIEVEPKKESKVKKDSNVKKTTNKGKKK